MRQSTTKRPAIGRPAPPLGAEAEDELRAAALALGTAIDDLNRIDAELDAMDDGEAQDAFDDEVFQPAYRRREEAEKRFHEVTNRLGVGGVVLGGRRAFFTWASESDKTGQHCGYSAVHDLATVVTLDA